MESAVNNPSKQTRQLDADLMFYPVQGDPIKTHSIEVSATYESDRLVGCQVTFDVDWEIYTRIENEFLFHLTPEARGANLGEPFDPQKQLRINAALDNKLVPTLKENGESIDDIAKYMLQLSVRQADDSLFETENWFALTVSQPVTLPPDLMKVGEVFTGYSTIWRDEDSMTNEDKSPGNQSLFDIVLDYFKSREWPYDQIEEQPTLHLSYSGENGDWDYFAYVNEENQQASFYSIYPEKTPEKMRTAMAELLTRINYGMPIGNFEMDMDDGEIRFKTSVDVTDDRLSFGLLTQLSESNLYLMDRYYPAIQSVIDDGTGPLEALGLIED